MAATLFKIERVKRELTQTELAGRSGVPQHRISLLERGVIPHNVRCALRTNKNRLF